MEKGGEGGGIGFEGGRRRVQGETGGLGQSRRRGRRGREMRKGAGGGEAGGNYYR